MGITGTENVEGKAGVVGGWWRGVGGQVTMSRMNSWGRVVLGEYELQCVVMGMVTEVEQR